MNVCVVRPTSLPWAALALAASVIVAGSPVRAEMDAQTAFATWSRLASAAAISPAEAEPGDAALDWTGPDGRAIRLVVKQPRPRPDAPTVTLAAVPAGADPGPAFARALAEVRATGAGRLVVPPGTYAFPPPARSAQAHLVLDQLSDVTIDGGGATFVFEGDKHGILVTRSRRLRLANVVIRYGLRTASVATAAKGADGQMTLTLVEPPGGGPTDKISYVAEYDPASRRWVPGGGRVILPDGHRDTATSAGGASFRSPAFGPLKDGRAYTVFHQFYGGNAIQIQDAPSSADRQAEDVTIDRVTIRSGPGMGIVAYGLKRGLLVTHTTIAPDEGRPVSVSYDAIHVLLTGGDVIIADNTIERAGDDGINLNSPVHPIVSLGPDRTLVLGTYSRFISPGERLAFFDGEGRYLGQAGVLTRPVLRGGPNNQHHEITLDADVPGIDTTSAVRDIALIGGRFAVLRNRIGPCHCNAILAQLPNGLVEDNVIDGASHAAINLLTSVGPFKEGVGVFNVIVRNNTIRDGGIKASARLPWGGINLYGLSRANAGTSGPVNRDVAILGNTVANARQGCVMAISSDGVEVRDNTCQDTNRAARRASIAVSNATRVTVSGNRRLGSATGGLDVDSAGASVQPSY